MERRDDSSRDAPSDARETRRRYPADEVSRCGRWMQRAGGVALFPGGRDERMRCLPSSRGCPARSRSGPQPSGPKQGEASCAGLRPEGIYVYVERSQGRTNRPPCTGSTVAPTVTARWKATSTATHTATSKTSGAKVSFLIYYRT